MLTHDQCLQFRIKLNTILFRHLTLWKKKKTNLERIFWKLYFSSPYLQNKREKIHLCLHNFVYLTLKRKHLIVGAYCFFTGVSVVVTLYRLMLFCVLVKTEKELEQEGSRQRRLLNAFSIVNFPNDVCTTTDSTYTKGTCYSR